MINKLEPLKELLEVSEFERLQERLLKAYAFAELKHRGQKRIGGDDFIMHPVSVCTLLIEKGITDPATLISALYHDLLEDTDATEQEILEHCTFDNSEEEIALGREVIRVVKAVTKVKGYVAVDYIGGIKQERERHVKLADRVHNLRSALVADEKKRRKYIRGSIEYFIEMSKGTIFEKEIVEGIQNLIDNTPINDLFVLVNKHLEKHGEVIEQTYDIIEQDNKAGYIRVIDINRDMIAYCSSLDEGEGLLIEEMGLMEEEFNFIMSKPDGRYVLITAVVLEPQYRGKELLGSVFNSIEDMFKGQTVLIYPYPILEGYDSFNVEYARSIQEKIRKQYEKIGYKTLENGLMTKE